MNPARWKNLDRLFHSALERSALERTRFLNKECAGDEGLRREVEALLAAHEKDGSFIESPALEIEARELADNRTKPKPQLAEGQMIGHYRIAERIGTGGMGEVYRAHDQKLRREVALKILPPEFASDEERMSRFEREAHMLAALNHPNIAAIYGLEEWEGRQVLVMELVEGPTLNELLVKGPLGLEKAERIAFQIAEALEAAHGKRIVHRDLKPLNVKLTPEGKVKVLDFGLARVWAGEGTGVDLSEASTMIGKRTQTGMILGTPAYMSPEQARGNEVDKETDIWAFGCVVFELFTGTSAFGRETATDTVAAILKEEPDWRKLPKATPENLRCLLRRALQKDLRCRLQDIGDARIELEDTIAGRMTPAVSRDERVRSKKTLLAAALAILFVGAAGSGGLAWRLARRSIPAPPVTRFTIPLSDTQQIVTSWNPGLMFSRDGRMLAFNSQKLGYWFAYRRALDDLEVKALTGVKNLGMGGGFSPDDKWVVGIDNATLQMKKVALSGGAPVLLTDVDMWGRGDWGSDGFIYFTERYAAPISRMPENGGKKELVTTLDPEKQEFTHKHAEILPGGKAIIFTVTSAGTESYNDAKIDVQRLDTKERKTLIEGGFMPRYSPSGHIVYARDGSLYAVPFDVGHLEVTGPSVKVVDGVLMSTNTGAAYFDVSSTGSLAYAEGRAEGGERTLVWVDRQGNAKPLPLPPRSYLYPRISPDQKTLAVEVEGPTHNLYTYDFARSVMTKMTTDGLSHAPVWTPDGKSLLFRSWKSGTMTMWQMPFDRSGPETRLTSIGTWQSPVSVSLDGHYLTFDQRSNNDTKADAYVLPLDGSGKPQPLVQTKFADAGAKFSPDGKWVVYCSNESGKPEVFVQRWPGPGPKITISSEGGTDPLWSMKGDEIFYRNGDKMMVVPVSLVGEFKPGKPRLLWEGHYSPGMSSSCGPPGVSSGNYSITADGQHFLMVKDNDQDVYSKQLVVILNWSQTLEGLTGGK